MSSLVLEQAKGFYFSLKNRRKRLNEVAINFFFCFFSLLCAVCGVVQNNTQSDDDVTLTGDSPPPFRLKKVLKIKVDHLNKYFGFFFLTDAHYIIVIIIMKIMII